MKSLRVFASVSGRTVLVGLSLATLLTTRTLAAQAAAAAAAPSCPIDMLQPGELGLANQGRQSIISAKSADEARKAMQQAMKYLNNPKVGSNPAGRDYLLAQLLTLMIGNGGEIQTRGSLGLPGLSTQPVDLVVAVDSLFAKTENAQPACKTDIAEWRQYKPFVAMVQSAYRTFGANNADSAEYYAKRALILAKDTPQPYDVLWRVAQKKNDMPSMITNMAIAAKYLETDTANASVRINLLFNIGRTRQDYADTRPEAEKVTLYKESVAPLMEVLKIAPSSDEAPFALQLIFGATLVTKDTASTLAALDIVKKDFGKFGDPALANAGVISTNLNRTPEAAYFFELAAKANPYAREYLYNQALMLFTAKRAGEMFKPLRQLLAIDPSNPDDYQLMGLAFSEIRDSISKHLAPHEAALAAETKKGAKADAAKKKMYADSVAFWAPQKKVWNDSVNVYAKVFEEMPHRLVFTAFERGKEKTTLKGSIENKSKTARSFTVEFEFLAKDGSTVGKQSATVGPVVAGGIDNFNVTLPKGGVYGVKYPALPPR